MEDFHEFKSFLVDFKLLLRSERQEISIRHLLELFSLLLPFFFTIFSSQSNLLTTYSPLLYILLAFIFTSPRLSTILQDMILFYCLSVSFGQKLFPQSPIDVLIWSLFTATAANSSNRKLGLTVVVFAHLLSAPVLVLDWMRWWQVWPNPANVAIGLTQACVSVYSVFAK